MQSCGEEEKKGWREVSGWMDDEILAEIPADWKESGFSN